MARYSTANASFLDKDKILSINVFCLYQHFFVKNRNEERIWKNEK